MIFSKHTDSSSKHDVVKSSSQRTMAFLKNRNSNLKHNVVKGSGQRTMIFAKNRDNSKHDVQHQQEKDPAKHACHAKCSANSAHTVGLCLMAETKSIRVKMKNETILVN